jgi:hypothetical protein
MGPARDAPRSAWEVHAAFGLVALLTACIVIGAATVGWRTGHANSTRPQPRPPSTQRLGPWRLVVPRDWSLVSARESHVPGLDPARALTYETLPGLPAHAVVVRGRATDRSLIPLVLRRVLDGLPGPPRPIRVAGYEGWAYASQLTRAGGMTLDVAVVPTTAGILGIGCTAPSELSAGTHSCAQVIERISFGRAVALRPRPDLAFLLRLGSVLERLRSRRAQAYRALLGARDHRGQAAGLHDVADAYGRASRELAPLATRGDSGRLVSALRAVGDEYQATADAAAAGDPAGYDFGRLEIGRLETRAVAAVGRVRTHRG